MTRKKKFHPQIEFMFCYYAVMLVHFNHKSVSSRKKFNYKEEKFRTKVQSTCIYTQTLWHRSNKVVCESVDEFMSKLNVLSKLLLNKANQALLHTQLTTKKKKMNLESLIIFSLSFSMSLKFSLLFFQLTNSQRRRTILRNVWN